ncbi:hypothetical protein M0Q50_09135 [bacterium]|jgi:hypothetical protein|nr:hypothetical protein [bacterium]
MNKKLPTIKFKDDIEFIEFYRDFYKKEYEHIIYWTYKYDNKLNFAFCIGEYKKCSTCSYNIHNDIGIRQDAQTCTKIIKKSEAKQHIRMQKLNSI